MNNTGDWLLTTDEAVKLIQSDSRDNPVVDIQAMVFAVEQRFLRVDKTFRIPFLGIGKDRHGRRIYTQIGEKYIIPKTEYERATFEHFLMAKYEEESGKSIDLERAGIKSVSSVIDDQNRGGRPVEAEAQTQVGDTLKTETINQKNGA